MYRSLASGYFDTQMQPTTHYTKLSTKITTHTPEYADHKALILDLP